MTMPEPIYELMRAYFDGDTSPETAEAIEAWLVQDPANLRLFAEYGYNEDLLYAEQRLIDSEAIHTIMVEQPSGSDWNAWYDQATQQTDQANVGAGMTNELVTARQAFLLLAYLIRKAATSRPAIKAYVATAMLTIVVTLLFVFSTDDRPSEEQWVDQQPARDSLRDSEVVDSSPRLQTIVATLTNDTNAAWHRRPGQDLYAGQKFTLTRGYAEVTTNRGAIAIIEAPATFELTEGDNAIRLHTGKLVGVCEVDTSKGFVVHTPHSDITDIGTRFGVDVTSPEKTEVHVFEGMVEVTRQDPDGVVLARKKVLAGKALAVTTHSMGTQTASTPNRFELSPGLGHLQPDFAGTPAIWLGEVPKDLRLNKVESAMLQVFIEREGHFLDQDVAVDFNRDHPSGHNAGVLGQVVLAGQRVDVYLLQLDRQVKTPLPNECSVHFGRPILGVIGSHHGLVSTDASLGAQGVMYPNMKTVDDDGNPIPEGGVRGIEYMWDKANNLDVVSVSQDEGVLNLKVYEGGSVDQIRVLVKAQDPAEQSN